MQMFAGDVPMLENDARLLAVTHAFHIFAGYFAQPVVGQPVFRRGIERRMEYRVGRSSIRLQVGHETLHAGIDIQPGVPVIGVQHLLK